MVNEIDTRDWTRPNAGSTGTHLAPACIPWFVKAVSKTPYQRLWTEASPALSPRVSSWRLRRSPTSDAMLKPGAATNGDNHPVVGRRAGPVGGNAIRAYRTGSRQLTVSRLDEPHGTSARTAGRGSGGAFQPRQKAAVVMSLCLARDRGSFEMPTKST